MDRLFSALLTTALTVAGTAVLTADTAGSVAQYSFVVANAPKDSFSSDGRMRVRLMRWSTDDERRRLMAALDEPSKVISALPYVEGVVGYLQWPGGLEHSVRYARNTARPDGGADVFLVV